MRSSWVILVICLVATQAQSGPRKNGILNDELRRLLDPDSPRTSAVQRQTTATPSETNMDNADEGDSETESDFPCGGYEEQTQYEDESDESNEPPPLGQEEEAAEQEYESENDFDWEREMNPSPMHDRPRWRPWGSRRPPYPGWWGAHGF
ncbi:hypothetical protein FGIG_04601 [Fasciola gigantica]|uniref:Uncharacterized protein n=1 Tax=Fasciola gigantica TaxID=46835 RepID=A0A504ZAQ6_FASGI|nr:hypothetical protein FGIG_04601 [Fasciola gigantica]